MVNKSVTGTAANKKFEINNYTIEDGAHSLHKTMSFVSKSKSLFIILYSILYYATTTNAYPHTQVLL